MPQQHDESRIWMRNVLWLGEQISCASQRTGHIGCYGELGSCMPRLRGIVLILFIFHRLNLRDSMSTALGPRAWIHRRWLHQLVADQDKNQLLLQF